MSYFRKKRNENKLYSRYKTYYRGNKIPRKAKKFFLGTILNKAKIRKLKNNIQSDKGIPFCSKCGCESFHMILKPSGCFESWMRLEHADLECARCGKIIEEREIIFRCPF